MQACTQGEEQEVCRITWEGGPHGWWGPSPIKSLGGKAYYISFTNNKTCCLWVYLLVLKGESLREYLSFKAWMKIQHNVKIKWLCSDHSGKYLSNKFSNHLTTYDMPQENSVMEMVNHNLPKKVHAMLHSSQLPNNLWGEALMHAV